MIKIDKRLGVVLVLIIVLIIVYKLRNHFKGSSSRGSSSRGSSSRGSSSRGSSKSKKTSGKPKKSGKSIKSGNSGNSGNSGAKQPAKPNPPEKKGIMSSLFSFGDSNTKDNKKDNKKESSSSSESDDGLKEDAQQLYNLIHSDMCNGMTSEEFERRVGDLADNIIYIELVQLYQDHKDAGKNPERTVKSDHYEKVLEKQLS